MGGCACNVVGVSKLSLLLLVQVVRERVTWGEENWKRIKGAKLLCQRGLQINAHYVEQERETPT